MPGRVHSAMVGVAAELAVISACGGQDAATNPAVASSGPTVTAVVATEPSASDTTEAPGGGWPGGPTAPCPDLEPAPAVTSIDAPGTPPLSAVRSTGASTQTLRIDWQIELQLSDRGTQTVDRISTTFDVRVERLQATDSAPVLLEVLRVQPTERTVDGEPFPAGMERSLYPADGAVIGLLQGTSGLLTLNSDSTQWGEDLMGFLQLFLDAQVIVFPEQPVGVGATWRRTAHRDADGGRYDQTWLVTLDAFDGLHYVLHGTMTSRRDDRQALGGSTASTDDFRDVVEGHDTAFAARGRLDRPVPSSLEINSTGTQRSVQLELDNRTAQTITITETSAG